MSVYLVKHSARGFVGFGKFLSSEERESYVAAMCEAMDREYEARAERVDGKAVLFDVYFQPVRNQAEYDAVAAALSAAPVVNVLD